jgi:ligand-binding sensor domain-containing protein
MHLRLRVILPVVLCWAALGAIPPKTIRPVVLPVTDASDIRFMHVSFGSFKKEPAYNRVHAIAQDRNGFLWFATQDKLQRYDGYEIREYPDDPNSPSAVYTEESLFIDRRSILWGAGSVGWTDLIPLPRASSDSRQMDRSKRV